jgi:hypothetical protein
MRTVKWNPFLSGGCMLLGAMLLWAGAARADVSSTNPAAILIFPKLVVDEGVNTDIQLTNTSGDPVNVRCFYINANGHCANTGIVCDPNGDPAHSPCGRSPCLQGCQETDFRFRLTSKQPIVWSVADGLLDFPLANQPGAPGQFNTDSSIPPAPEVPFVGELKCIEVDANDVPLGKNDLKGEATITTDEPNIDIRGYNGIGVQAIANKVNTDNTLCLGGGSQQCPTAEYNSCPAVLLLDHFFDGASEPALSDTVSTDLTLVPCSEDLNLQLPVSTQVQFLVFNEFEQRFSTSRRLSCFWELALSDIDTRPGSNDDWASIFNVNVEGTLSGQTQIRGVGAGHGLLGVAEEFHANTERLHSAAFALDQRGTRAQPDTIVLPAPLPPSTP